ncbi:MAG: hypothetical protein HWD61_10175 [Parachlamydiaceae bacterium]|nr:MAG: hypothetical protein HWD61_10175 [Parachlamydiaceae bacterium]
MKADKALNHFAHIILYPSEEPSPSAKGLAWAVTIILGIFTLGITQGLSYLWLKLKTKEPTIQDQRIQNVFDRNNPASNSINSLQTIISKDPEKI